MNVVKKGKSILHNRTHLEAGYCVDGVLTEEQIKDLTESGHIENIVAETPEPVKAEIIEETVEEVVEPVIEEVVEEKKEDSVEEPEKVEEVVEPVDEEKPSKKKNKKRK